ncbi:MAG: hypothetical protein ACTH30_03590 [Leucobacter sp.]
MTILEELPSSTRFSVKVPFPLWTQIFCGLVAVGLPAGLMWHEAATTMGSQLPHIACVIVALLSVLFIAIGLSHQTIESVEDGTLLVRWVPFIDMKIPASQIEHTMPTQISFWGYGLRLRILGGGILAFVFRSGPGVILKVEKNRRYVLTLGSEEK